jgi:hypothetical protein
MYRRQAVESVNAALQGAFADISRGFFRVFGRTKITFLLGFTVVRGQFEVPAGGQMSPHPSG